MGKMWEFDVISGGYNGIYSQPCCAMCWSENGVYQGLYRYIDCIAAVHGCFNTEDGDSVVDFCVFPIIKVPKPYNVCVANITLEACVFCVNGILSMQ